MQLWDAESLGTSCKTLITYWHADSGVEEALQARAERRVCQAGGQEAAEEGGQAVDIAQGGCWQVKAEALVLERAQQEGLQLGYQVCRQAWEQTLRCGGQLRQWLRHCNVQEDLMQGKVSSAELAP